MAITLSHQSALDVLRTIRCEGINTHEMEVISLATPSAWVGRRLSMKNFAPDVWRWNTPNTKYPLHILVPNEQTRMRGKGILAHRARGDMPAGAALWVDEHSSVVCPELLFLQMAEYFTLSSLVMLGMELCGHFSRHAAEPLMEDVVDGIPAATSVENLAKYLSAIKWAKGLRKARTALRFVCDHAVSAPEAVLATMFGLPPAESGYGMGPLQLNERVRVDESGSWVKARTRYPDLMFDFAPVGLNYDGSKHFDIEELMAAAETFAQSDTDGRSEARKALRRKFVTARTKVVDDNMRDRQLAAQGRIVFSVTKEDLKSISRLDNLTRQVLSCANKVFGAAIDEHVKVLDDSSRIRERDALLGLLTPQASFGGPSYGRL